jgi:hypothetical protein
MVNGPQRLAQYGQGEGGTGNTRPAITQVSGVVGAPGKGFVVECWCESREAELTLGARYGSHHAGLSVSSFRVVRGWGRVVGRKIADFRDLES